MNKALRQKVKAKFGGKCAYCGCDLGDKWHVDHLDPIIRNADGTVEHPENDVIANYMPSCVGCNLSKKRMSLDNWRNWIKGHIVSLNRDNPAYRTAKRFGLVVEQDIDVNFYFERDKCQSLYGLCE